MSQVVRNGGKRTFKQRFLTDPLTAFGLIIFWGVFRVMPVSMASFVGSGLGGVLPFFWRSKNRVALQNVKKCFPEKSEKEQRQIVRGMWHNLGRLGGEMPHIKKMIKTLPIEGEERLAQMKQSPKGSFIFSAHIGNWELATLLAMRAGFPIHLVYRVANNPWIEKCFFSRRQTCGSELIPKGINGARRMIELLKNGETIALMSDQKLREGIDVPFFGYPTKTAPAIATLALKMDLPMYPVRVVRDRGSRLHIEILPPITITPTGDKNADILAAMTRINALVESWIRENPTQWLWIHRRWDKSEYEK